MQFPSLHRFAALSILLATTALTITFLYVMRTGNGYFGQQAISNYHDDLISEQDPQGLDRVPCISPRGKLLSESADDQLHPRVWDSPYPQPLGGSYEALLLNKSWLTADGRYGPYGYGDEDAAGYSRSRVEWDSVNWASLQDNCLARNEFRFRNPSNITTHPKLLMPGLMRRLRLARVVSPVRDSRHTTGRTAIVIRSWDSYEYRKEDMINLRSLIVETSLSSGAEYAVFLLVHIKDKSKGIFSSDANYQAALNDTVPPELRGIAVLFDESLLESWYSKVGNHLPYFQMFQPLQLFAQVYSGFDHYWQMEMDVRFTGDTLHYLEAVSAFAKAEPRKQSVERGSFRYIPEVHGTYQDLLSAINSSVQGRGIWGPVHIPEIKSPIGPAPPFSDPIQDDFQWGVGSDADFIATVPCKSLPLTTTWLFADWIFGFADGATTPRLFCPQAVSRMSWNLLNAVHAAQVEQGLAIPSESTMPSFALWHGLKLSYPPQPWFLDPREDGQAMDDVINGSPPRPECSGFAFGTSSHDDAALDHLNWNTQQSWWWRSDLPKQIMDNWLRPDLATSDIPKLPYLLQWHDGQVYAPNLALHPFKTNEN